MNPHSYRVLFGVFTIGSSLVTSAFAQWSHRVDADLLATTTNSQAGGAVVAADGSGGVFAAWFDDRNTATSGRDIYIQRFNSDGIAQWTANGVAVVTASGTQDAPVVVPALNGAVYVAWPDQRVATGNHRIYAQYFNAAGVAQWTANGIRVGPSEVNQIDLVATTDGFGNLLVTWAEPTNNFRTFAQKFGDTGAPAWGATGFEYSSGVFGGASVINIVADGTGGAVIGWIRFGSNPRTVFMQRILPEGTAAFTPVGFGNDTSALGNYLPMAPDGTGGAIAAWQSDSGTNDNLYVQRVDGAGNLTWGSGSTILVDQPNVQEFPLLVSDGAGGAYCVWEDPRTSPSNTYIQRFTAAGTRVFAENGIRVGTSPGQRFTPRIVADGAGGAIVSFRFDQNGTFAQRIDAAGARLWTSDGVPLTDNGSVNFPSLTSDGVNGAILGVLAFTNGNRPALKRVLADGTLPTSRLVNLSTRAAVGTGEAIAIVGFGVQGPDTKNLLIRAAGPALAALGVPGTMPDPEMTFFFSNSSISNTDWHLSIAKSEIAAAIITTGAFTFADPSLHAAMIQNVGVGTYTVHGFPRAGTAVGLGIVEIYDMNVFSTPSRLINLSSRVQVGTGNNVAIPGFVIRGPATMTLLVRAVGPTLGGLGVANTLVDPILTIKDAAGASLQSNDNWGTPSSTKTELSQAAVVVGAFALNDNSLDSALLITLPPGNYTAGIEGKNNGVGICLVELYVKR